MGGKKKAGAGRAGVKYLMLTVRIGLGLGLEIEWLH